MDDFDQLTLLVRQNIILDTYLSFLMVIHQKLFHFLVN